MNFKKVINFSNVYHIAGIFIPLILAVLPFYKHSQINSVFIYYDKFKVDYFFSTWVPENFGSFGFFLIPFDFLAWLFYKFLPFSLAQILPYVLIQLIAYFSFYNLSRYLFSNNATSIVSSLFYIYSIYAQFMSGWSIHSGAMIYAVLPFFVYKFLIIHRGNFLYQVCQIAILNYLLIGINLTYVAYLYISILFVILIRLVLDFSKQNFLTLSSTFFTAIIFFVLSNALLLSTFISESFFDKNFLESSLASESFEWKSSASNISEVVREMGSVNFTYNFKGIYAYPNARIYFENPLYIFLSYYPVAFLLLALFIKSKNDLENKSKFVVLMAYLFFIFMSLGANESSPFVRVYMLLAENLPYFKVFRDSFKAVVVIHFIYALSIGYVLYRLRDFKFKAYLYSVVVFVILLLSFNYWTGSFFKYETIKVPKYWIHASNDYKKNFEQKRILFTPKMEFPVHTFLTKKIGNSTFYRPLFDFYMINTNSVFRYSNISNKIHENLSQNLLGFYSVYLVLNQYDVYWSLYDYKDPLEVKQLLESNNFKLIEKYE